MADLTVSYLQTGISTPDAVTHELAEDVSIYVNGMLAFGEPPVRAILWLRQLKAAFAGRVNDVLTQMRATDMARMSNAFARAERDLSLCDPWRDEVPNRK